ncbi:hypothetical protein P153DRAFT_18335 [Dothidotthia symphoricarpi CBS 119687]|uniref:Uncharacterized protein n=1 Tax=Dothidotthia symphoricarpi CBS 119687 TaxID=1392245 RepID=A0A6A6AG19_9PLEO|nr:uncharacterized protein P153DRAFT_18335 [Dothidotthia symphoricarpi CBS 119687]KAF2129361.1 hypothetical protein P153DRAFT_18335 [Dothidotthia symphoricarpi CBS 119687]
MSVHPFQGYCIRIVVWPFIHMPRHGGFLSSAPCWLVDPGLPPHPYFVLTTRGTWSYPQHYVWNCCRGLKARLLDILLEALPRLDRTDFERLCKRPLIATTNYTAWAKYVISRSLFHCTVKEDNGGNIEVRTCSTTPRLSTYPTGLCIAARKVPGNASCTGRL